MRSVCHESIELDERPFIQKHVKPLAGGQLAFRVLRLDPFRSPTLLRLGASALEEVQLFAHGHRPES